MPDSESWQTFVLTHDTNPAGLREQQLSCCFNDQTEKKERKTSLQTTANDVWQKPQRFFLESSVASCLLKCQIKVWRRGSWENMKQEKKNRWSKGRKCSKQSCPGTQKAFQVWGKIDCSCCCQKLKRKCLQPGAPCISNHCQKQDLKSC